MKEDILDKIRNERDTIIKSLQEGNERKRRLKELLNESLIKEFMKLSGLTFDEDLGMPVPSKNKIVNQIIEEYKEFEFDPEDTNRIYLCTGKNYRGMLVDGIYQLDIIGKPESVKCGWYCNIESEIDNYLIPIEECDEFEKNHTVIFHHDYEKIQSEFITCAVNDSQENAVKILLRKYRG